MGLTNSVVLPAMRDDPHGAFDGGDVNTIPASMKLVFDGFMSDLVATTDDNTLQVARRRHRDHDPRRHHEEPAAARRLAGRHAGQHQRGLRVQRGPPEVGLVRQASTGTARSTGFDATAGDATYNGANTAKFAMASIAYAIAKRDERAISTFANGVDRRRTTSVCRRTSRNDL